MYHILNYLFSPSIKMFKVHGFKQSPSNISNNFHHTKSEPSFLILKDVQGNMYKYIYPNDINQFSKMSTLGNKNSSTVIHLPPGILKSENPSNSFTSKTNVEHTDGPNIRTSSTTSEKPQITYISNDKHTTHKSNSKTKSSIDTFSFTNANGLVIKKNELTETTTTKNCKNENKNEKEEDDKAGPNEYNIALNDSQNILKTKVPLNIHNVSDYPAGNKSTKKCENSNKPHNLYKLRDTRNGLVLLVENDIKLKLFLNSNGILDEPSLIDSKKNRIIPLKDEFHTEDGIPSDDLPTYLSVVE